MGRKTSQGKRLTARQKSGGVLGGVPFRQIGCELLQHKQLGTQTLGEVRAVVRKQPQTTLRGRNPRDVNLTPMTLLLALLPLCVFMGLEDLRA